MAAMPGRLHGHYPDLARRSRGRRHSDIGGSWGLRRAAARRRAFLSKIGAGCMPQQTQTLSGRGAPRRPPSRPGPRPPSRPLRCYIAAPRGTRSDLPRPAHLLHTAQEGARGQRESPAGRPPRGGCTGGRLLIERGSSSHHPRRRAGPPSGGISLRVALTASCQLLTAAGALCLLPPAACYAAAAVACCLCAPYGGTAARRRDGRLDTEARGWQRPDSE